MTSLEKETLFCHKSYGFSQLLILGPLRQVNSMPPGFYANLSSPWCCRRDGCAAEMAQERADSKHPDLKQASKLFH